MNYQEKCQCCGHVKTAYTISLNAPMAKAFCKFAEMYLEYKLPLKKGQIGLRNEQYTNFQNLRHFGIIKQIDNQRWILTNFGENFYYGESCITEPVAHMGGETLSEIHDAWGTHRGTRTRRYIHEILDHSEWTYKKRPQFQEEKSLRQPLFS